MAWNVFVHPLSSTVIGLEDDRPTPAGEIGVQHEGIAARFDLAADRPRLTALWFSHLELDGPQERLGAVIGDEHAQRWLAVANDIGPSAEVGTDVDYDPDGTGTMRALFDEGAEEDVVVIEDNGALLTQAALARDALLRRYPLNADGGLPDWARGPARVEDLGDRPFVVPQGDGSRPLAIWWRGLADSALQAFPVPYIEVERNGGGIRVTLPGPLPEVDGLVARLVDEGDDPDGAVAQPEVVARVLFRNGFAEIPEGEIPEIAAGAAVRVEIIDHPLRPVLDELNFAADMARQAGVVAVASTETRAGGDVVAGWWNLAAAMYVKAARGADAEAAGSLARAAAAG